MEFPEVWNVKQKFKAVKKETFTSSDAVAVKISSKLPLARMISILLPEADTAQLENLIDDSDYYSAANFSLASILNKNFVEGFLRNGNFACQPGNCTNDDDTFSISSNKLQMKIHKETLHAQHAVELSKFKTRGDDEISHYSIDLLSAKLDLPRLCEDLKNIFNDFPVSFSWVPTSSDICSSSIAKYFSDGGLNVKLCKNKFIKLMEYGLRFPNIDDDDESRLEEISEYVGMVLLGCNLEENDFSSYSLPSDCVDVGRGKVLHCKGFITQPTVEGVINEIRRILKENPNFPWIALSLVVHAGPEMSSKLFIISMDKINSI